MADKQDTPKRPRSQPGPLISHSELCELMSYDPDTGLFRWNVDRQGHAKAGEECGTLNKTTGYHAIKLYQRAYHRARAAWFYVHGVWPSEEIDHINGVRNDDRLVNLREASRTQNLGNTRRHRDNKTGFKGVTRHPRTGMYEARIQKNKHCIFLGAFSTAEEAHSAYVDAAHHVFKEYARTE